MNSLFAVALTVALIPVLTGCATIQPGEVGVKKSMGVLNKNLLGPGIHGYNFMLDDIDVVSIKQETVEGTASPLTADQQPLDIQYKVQYSLPEKQILNLISNYKGDPYASLVTPQVQEAFRQVVSQYKADAVIKKQNEVQAKVLASVREKLAGLVNIADIPVTHIAQPPAIAEAVAQKQVMEQDALKKQYELDKETKQAEITVTKARAEAQSIKLQSEALANSPKLVELKWVEKWDGKLPETMAGNSSLIMGLKK